MASVFKNTVSKSINTTGTATSIGGGSSSVFSGRNAGKFAGANVIGANATVGDIGFSPSEVNTLLSNQQATFTTTFSSAINTIANTSGRLIGGSGGPINRAIPPAATGGGTPAFLQSKGQPKDVIKDNILFIAAGIGILAFVFR